MTLRKITALSLVALALAAIAGIDGGWTWDKIVRTTNGYFDGN